MAAVVVFLILLALAGGAAGTYFLMDAPRRRAQERLAQLEDGWRELDEDRARFDGEDRRLRDRKRELAASAAAHEERERALAAREAEFGRRAITYDDLAGENRILRTDLKNAVVHAAYLEQLQHANRSGATAASGQRDQLGRAYFEEVVASAKRAVTPNNYPTVKQKVRTAAERVRGSGAELPPAEEEKALAAVHDLFERALRASAEREEQARIREQMREEQARQKEVEAAEEAAERAERERVAAESALQAALERALAEAAGKHASEVGDLAGRHASEVEELRARLAEAEAKAERTKSLAQLTRQGHVYVISNVGSFGPGVFKIGMTRRQEPQDRVDELGDASVPFPFDVHMMIRCEDAPKLESALHQHFRSSRVNRVNLRKEFFRVSIEEVAAAVREHHGEVEYTADAEALEYVNSLAATDADVEEMEGARARAEAHAPPATAAVTA